MTRRAALAALLAVGLAGCGYALVGTGRGILPEGASAVFVETFVNDALELVQQVIEASIEPLIDVATEIRGSRAGAWWRARTSGWSDTDAVPHREEESR